jgi:glycosyltransferase involved in cell wall biosynthesis
MAQATPSATTTDPSVPADAPGQLAPRRRVRVLFMNDTARNGGPGRSLFYILKFLDPKIVHRSVVLPRRGVISEMYEEAQITEDLAFEPGLVENPFEPWDRAVEREDLTAPVWTRGVRAAGNVVRATLGMGRLQRRILGGAYDLIYCNGTNADFAGGALSFTSGVPAIWHVRYTSVPPALRGVHDRLAGSKGVRRIICVSHAAAQLFPHCPDKVQVIHNALDAEEFAPSAVAGVLRKELGLSADAVVFGSQGRILPRKGYVEMIRAADSALKTLGTAGDNCHFVVLGDTPADIGTDHLSECRELVRSLGRERQIRFLGFRADVKPYVVDFDVSVVPSVYPDPLPRAVIESMAFGKAVLAFDVGGVGEMVKNGQTGALMPGGDIEALAQAFVAYAGDPARRLREGAAARERVLAGFDSRAQARRIQDEIVRASGLLNPG